MPDNARALWDAVISNTIDDPDRHGRVPVIQPTTNGAMNTMLPEDFPAHDWYRFVLSFPPHLVRDYADRFGLGTQHRLLDPFCGTGTTLVEAKKLGIPSIGVESVGVPRHAANTKTDWSPDPDILAAHAHRVAETAKGILARDNISDEPMEETPTGLRLRSLPQPAAKLLLKNSISPLPLHKVLVLRDVLKEMRRQELEAHEQLALARALASDISNLKFGPEVGVGKIKSDARVVGDWLSRVISMSDDLRKLNALDETPSQAIAGDARSIHRCIEPCSVDAVITSPPYPNEKDYSRIVRLESVLLGYIDNRSDLQRMKRGLLRSNTRGVYRNDDDDAWVNDDSEIDRIANAIENRRMELGKNSGFERMYHRVTRLYFGGMARHFVSLSRVLRPGARLAYVVGDQASYLRVMIRTGQILGGIAERAGYEVEAINLFRTRHATATNRQLREEVLVLKWPGTGRHGGCCGRG